MRSPGLQRIYIPVIQTNFNTKEVICQERSLKMIKNKKTRFILTSLMMVMLLLVGVLVKKPELKAHEDGIYTMSQIQIYSD